MPIFSIIITIIATILIAPSGSDWVFNLSGGSRTVSLVLLGIFWTIDIIWLFTWLAKNREYKDPAIDNSTEQKEESYDEINNAPEELWEEYKRRHMRHTKGHLILLATKSKIVMSVYQNKNKLAKCTKLTLVKALWIAGKVEK